MVEGGFPKKRGVKAENEQRRGWSKKITKEENDQRRGRSRKIMLKEEHDRGRMPKEEGGSRERMILKSDDQV